MKIPVLLSYYVLRKSEKVLDRINLYSDSFRIIIDSGAYSALTLGKVISIEEYCDWLKSFDPKVQYDGAFQLDKIYDQEQTSKNFKIHERLGSNVIPIFTYAEYSDQINLLNSLVKHHEYVGCGGVRKKKQYVRWLLESCIDTSKIHLFAYSDVNLLWYYKPRSCDNSTWLNGTKYGELRRKDYNYHNEAKIGFSSVKKFGFQEKDYDKLNDPEWRHTKGKYLGISVPFATTCAAFLYQVQKLEEQGVQMYLVVSSAEHIDVLYACYQYFIKGKSIDLFKKEG
jgi:hypothetical protein